MNVNDAATYLIDVRYTRGMQVHWAFRGGTGYGSVQGIARDASNDDAVMYRVHVYYRHRSADGTLEPATRIHSGAALHPDSSAREKARAEYNKFKGTRQQGVLAL